MDKRASLAKSAALLLVALIPLIASCSASPSTPTGDVDYEQYVATELPDSSVEGPVVSLTADGSVLRVERWETPECWAIPVLVTQEMDQSLIVDFEPEAADDESACPNSAGWVVSDIQLPEPVTSESIEVRLNNPNIPAEGSLLTATKNGE
ncbi:hypothetical protein [Pseudoclavibacter helvolus]|uniref:hypothetical protein n=1 Tax=Pseudoclavibacter helvolus TaxID=255205 RepID=UPI003734D5C7